MNRLPSSWIIRELADIANLEMGQSPDSQFYNTQGEGLPFFQGKAEFGSLYPTVCKWCVKPTKIAESGDILLSVRAPVGPTNIANERCCIGRGLAAIRAEIPSSQKYLFYYFRYIEPWLVKQGTGSTFASVSGGFLRELEVIIAPLNEQKRIADKLDSILARVDACRERLDRIPVILKRFRQAVLAAATSGKLTEEWRGTSETEEWVTMPLAKVCISITDGDHQAPPQAENGIPFITISAISNGRLRLEKASRFVPLYYFNALKENRRPQRGDVLYSVTGSIGIPVLVDTDSSFVFQRHISILKPDYSKITSDYLKYAMGADNTLKQAYAIATGTAQLTIPLNGLRSLLIDVPPLKEQTEIVRRVEELFAYADRIEARYQAARARVDKLTPAILAKAFRGELMPQNPDDEPASVLLERIRASRAKIVATLKPKRSRNKAISATDRN